MINGGEKKERERERKKEKESEPESHRKSGRKETRYAWKRKRRETRSGRSDRGWPAQSHHVFSRLLTSRHYLELEIARTDVFPEVNRLSGLGKTYFHLSAAEIVDSFETSNSLSLSLSLSLLQHRETNRMSCRDCQEEIPTSRISRCYGSRRASEIHYTHTHTHRCACPLTTFEEMEYSRDAKKIAFNAFALKLHSRKKNL